jgi:hypothetical protein
MVYRIGDAVVSSTHGVTWYGIISWICGSLITVRKTSGPEAGKRYKHLPER